MINKWYVKVSGGIQDDIITKYFNEINKTHYSALSDPLEGLYYNETGAYTYLKTQRENFNANIISDRIEITFQQFLDWHINLNKPTLINYDYLIEILKSHNIL